MNLWDLWRDAVNALRFRFQAAHDYRYGGMVFLVVALAIGVSNAVALLPALGQTAAVFMFGIVIGLGRWLILTRAMTSVLHYFGAPKIAFLGYTLATEALVLPNILLFYMPELASLLMFWNVWVFWAQLAGFRELSGGASGRALVCAYMAYFVGTGVFMGVMLALFTLGGWLNPQELGESLKTYMEHNQR
ncbi:hypothetical protein ACKLNO_07815 [Neisseriaceae bacterium B1]